MEQSFLARTGFRVAFTLYAVALVIWLGLGLMPSGMTHGSGSAMDVTTGLQTTVQYLFSVLNLGLGLFLVWRRPDDLVPRLLGVALLGTAATFNIPSHRAFHLLGSPWPIASIHFTFHVVSGVAYVWAVVLFPNGTLPRRLRVGRGVRGAAVVLTTGLVALVCWRGSFLDHPQFFVVFFGIAVAVTGVGAQLIRILDSSTTPRDRATARLLSAALLPAFTIALVWLGTRALELAGGTGPEVRQVQTTVQDLFPAVFAVVPVVLCAGVVRYRLWDIDRLLSRVLVYGFISVALSAAYVVAVVTGGWLAGGGLWFTVLVLSVTAVAVEPLRLLGRRWANRVVFGQVLSPTEAMQRLTGTLDRLTPEGELQRVVDVAVAATRAESAELWVLDGDRLVRTVRSPAAAAAQEEVVLAGPERGETALTHAVGAERGWAVMHHGHVLGLLTADVRPGSALTAVDGAVMGDIAAHAGLLVHNASLTVILARQVAVLARQADELRASRRRLVAAQDAERRRLERDLHDGAQQALVATIIGARAALAHPPVSPAEVLELREVLAIARDATVDLCGDGRPQVLVSRGLRGALDQAAAIARSSGLDVEVHVEVGALRPELEAAIYFCCVESLQNVAKYAGAASAAVVVSTDDADITFTIVDDGTGFDPQTEARTGGLELLAERLAVLGGQLTVTVGPTGGSAVRGRVPLGADAMVPA